MSPEYTDEERGFTALFETVEPPSRLWEMAVERASSRPGWRSLASRLAPARSVHPRPLVTAIGLAATVGVGGILLGAHRLADSAQPFGPTAGASSRPPAGASPAAADVFVYGVTVEITGPGPKCAGVSGVAGPYLTYLEQAQVACATKPPTPPAGYSVNGANPAVYIPQDQAMAQALPGTYVIHLDSCSSKSAWAVTVSEDAQNQAQVVQVVPVAYGEAVQHSDMGCNAVNGVPHQ